MKKISYLSEFEHWVLLALKDHGDSGYAMAIRREIEERTERNVVTAALYSTLGRLEKRGYLTSRLGDPTPERGGRAKRYFQITTEGMIALDEAARVLGRTAGQQPLEAITMPLVHGRPMSAEEVETIVSRKFTPQLFASLCNATTWAVSGRRCGALPSFTERVNVKDYGIDAEWQIEIQGGDESPLLGPGLNVHQYKQRDIFAQGRKATLRGLAAGLEGAVRDVERRTVRRLDRYVLFTNLDLSHQQKTALIKAILKGSTRRRIPVHIVGAGDLAALLNSAPHLRSAFFVSSRFSTWQSAWDALRRTKIHGADVSLVGRDAEVARIRSFIDDPRVRAIILTGPHNIGKSRLALEACKDRPYETVVAIDARSIEVPDVVALASPSTETTAIIDDPDVDLTERLVECALVNERLKTLITLPTSETAPTPNFGRDARVQTMALEPLSDIQAGELLRAANASLDYSLESWVVNQAGGIPGILLFAASLGPELRQTATLADSVGPAFELKVKRVLGQSAVTPLRLLSLLTHVGVSGPPAEELGLICRILGDGMTPSMVLDVLPRCGEAGVVRSAGQYAEVVPPLFANHLAGAALRSRPEALYSLFGALGPAGRLRLVERLRGLNTQETAAFWDTLFAEGGLFGNLPGALPHARLLRLIAGTVPAKVAHFVHEGLVGATREDRQQLEGGARRDLMWVLEELLFREETARTGLECIGMLAEAENEEYGNNATGVFRECFHPFHPQMPLSLPERIDVLQGFLGADQAREKKLLAVNAIDTALGHSPAVMLRRSEGREPLGAPPSLTYGEVCDYLDALTGLLMNAAHDSDTEVVTAATDRLPHVLAQSVLQGRPNPGMERLETLVDWTISGHLPLDVASVSDEVDRIREELRRRSGGARGDARSRIDAAVKRAQVLTDRLCTADYPTRVKRSVGTWGRIDREEDVDDQGQTIFRGEKEIKALAREAVENPGNLSEDLLSWLCTPDAQKSHIFSHWLGRLDQHRIFLETMEQIGSTEAGSGLLAPYLGGVAQNDRGFVSKRLDELVETGSVTGFAIVSATGQLGGDEAGVERTVRLLRAGKVDPAWTARVLSIGRWIEPLSQEQYLQLVQAIAGPTLDRAMAVIDFLGMWRHLHKPVEGDLADFAWRCLEARPEVKVNQHFYCDELAASLVPSDPERAFRLLETSLGQRDWDHWNPLRYHGQRSFWSALLDRDRARALRLVLSTAFGSQPGRYTILWDLRDLLDQERDADQLIAFGFEGQGQAETVADALSAARPGFWPIAFRLIHHYPKNERIQSSLAGAARHMGDTISGPLSTHFEKCRREVEARLDEPTTPSSARPWLKKLVAACKAQAERELLTEIEEDVNGWRRVVEQPDAPERGWAITTLLRLGKVRETLQIAEQPEVQSISRVRLDLLTSLVRATPN